MGSRDAGIKIEGQRELRKTLRAAGDDLEDLKAAHKAAAEIAAGGSRPLAPVRSGDLAGTIRAGGTKTSAVIRAGKKAVPTPARFIGAGLLEESSRTRSSQTARSVQNRNGSNCSIKHSTKHSRKLKANDQDFCFLRNAGRHRARERAQSSPPTRCAPRASAAITAGLLVDGPRLSVAITYAAAKRTEGTDRANVADFMDAARGLRADQRRSPRTPRASRTLPDRMESARRGALHPLRDPRQRLARRGPARPRDRPATDRPRKRGHLIWPASPRSSQ